MKNLITLLSFLFFLSCSHGPKVLNNTTKSIVPKTGVVEYDISLKTKDNIDPTDFGTKAKTTFNSEKLYFKKLDGKDTESFQIIDLATGDERNYITFRDKKYALLTSEGMIPPVGEFTFQDDKKVIQGYQCQKATAPMGDSELVAWFTQDMGVNFCPYVTAKGFALEYTLNMGYGQVTYTASKVSLQPVDEKLFQPPAEYKDITMEELQAELMGGPIESNFKKGETLANFDLTDMNGKRLQLSDLKGKVVLINFWFINCPPCRMEMPDLNELKAEYAGKNVEFVAITFDNKNDVNEFLKTIPFDYQILPNARAIIEKYGIMGFPTSVVLDKNGKVVDSKMGGSMNIKEELKAFIEVAMLQ